MDDFSWLYDIGFIRWISGFFSEEKLRPVFRWFSSQLAHRTPAQLAGRFFAWAVVLAVLAMLVDQTIYWTSREQQSKARRFIARVRLIWRQLYRAVERRVRLSGAGRER
ncbi:MAG: hypothetical protein GX549_06230 [Clostridiales bacterium]|nr:hypothetical protein [Clostridiales bacterium]